MAIGGVGSTGNSYYRYQLSLSQLKAARNIQSRYIENQQAVQPVSRVSRLNRVETTDGSSSMSFLKSYSSTMADLVQSSNALRQSNRTGVVNDLEVKSSDDSVAEASERYKARSSKEIDLQVTQLASAQVNTSDPVTSSAQAGEDMSFSISNSQGKSVEVKVSQYREDGASKTNDLMLKEAAAQINSQSDVDVKAYVEEKDGASSLRLESVKTGKNSGFQVSGDTGVADSLERVTKAAQNAIYSVTDKGVTTTRESSVNEAAIDNGRIGITFHDTGKATISSQVSDEKIVSAVKDFTKNYNKALDLLQDNTDRGASVPKQLEALTGRLASKQSLEQLGITTKEDGSLVLDEETLKKNLKKSPDLTKELLSGSNGIGQKGFQVASEAMKANAYGLIGNDLEDMQKNLLNDSYNFMNVYSQTGAYNMSNYNALGLMINYLV